jgi:hypothetical protein
MKGGDDISRGILKHLYIVLSDSDILWDNKEKQLLGKNYFKYSGIPI